MRFGQIRVRILNIFAFDAIGVLKKPFGVKSVMAIYCVRGLPSEVFAFGSIGVIHLEIIGLIRLKIIGLIRLDRSQEVALNPKNQDPEDSS